MALVVATRMKPSSPRHVPAFVVSSFRSASQARHSPGFLGGHLRIAGALEFWTLTMWEDRHHMAAYRDGGFHGRIMPSMRRWAKEAASAAWLWDDEEPPSWQEARKRITSERAYFIEVERPTADHAAARIRPTRRRGLIATL